MNRAKGVVSLTLPEAYHLSLARSHRHFTASAVILRDETQRQSRPKRDKFQPTARFRSGPSQPSTPIHAPTKPRKGDVARRLRESLATLCSDDYIRLRLETIGLKESISRVIARHADLYAHPHGTHISEAKSHDALRHLLEHWSSQREDQLNDELRHPHRRENALLAEGLATMEAQMDKDRNKEPSETGMRSSFVRMQVNAFLDWIQSVLAEITTDNNPSETIQPHSRQAAGSLLTSLASLRESVALRTPAALFPLARYMKRAIHLHVGPTNSGKTHGALVRLVNAHSGLYLGPLRLLAHEVWDRINRGTVSPGVPARSCNLKTGEERRAASMFTTLTSCTVEMAALNVEHDIAVIDEIQMIGDPDRGSAWTQAVLGLPAKELHLCGEDTVIPLIKKLAAECGDDLTIHQYQRLTPLKAAEESLESFDQIRPGDCVISFARSTLFSLKERIEQLKAPDGTPLRCAIAYGNLPPEIKAEQARLFNEGIHANVMVASDAIGMGLNLRIKRIIFDSLHKWNGSEEVPLSVSQIKQIAGRAGRYGTKKEGDEEGGLVTCMQERDMPLLREALAAQNTEIHRAAMQPLPEGFDHLSAALPPVRAFSASIRDKSSRGNKRDKATMQERKTLDVLRAANDAVLLDAGNNPELRRQELALAEAAIADLQLSDIYKDIELLTSLNSSNYFLSALSQQSVIAPMIWRASCLPESAGTSDDEAPRSLRSPPLTALTITEMENFASSPANTRDEKLMACLALFVRNYSQGRIVNFEEVVTKVGLQAALSISEQTEKELMAKWRSRKRTNAGVETERSQSGDQPSYQELASLTPPKTAIEAGILLNLESLHRALTLYQWLNARFPLGFSDKSSVLRYKERTERAIEFSLEVQRSARTKRLLQRGRNVGDEARQEKAERRRKNKDEYRGKGYRTRNRDGKHHDSPRRRAEPAPKSDSFWPVFKAFGDRSGDSHGHETSKKW